MATTLLTSTGPFTPRKEFQKSNHATHHFALLAFNGPDILRLTSFPSEIVSALKKVFEEQKVFRYFREDQELDVAEFILADKVWTGKSSRTERLVALIFSAIFSHQWRLVTPLAYGRLAQDTTSLVFSKEAPSSSGSANSSNNPSTFTNPGPANPGNLALGKQRASDEERIPSDTASFRTTFALSLSSKTVRVIRPPKHCTPAILASVRTAWPRGVISEGRPEDDVYEFQLKGYSLFSSSTFERDALSQIFTLLRTLDSHSLHLITNLNLTQGFAKSRTKDLWIFSAPADPPSPDPSLSPPASFHQPPSADSPSHSATNIPVRGTDPKGTMSVASGPGVAGLGAGYTAYLLEAEGARHIRTATSPEETVGGSPTLGHSRSVTVPTISPVPVSPFIAQRPAGSFGTPGPHAVLRKPPPGAIPIQEGGREGTIRGAGGFIAMPEAQPYPDGQGPSFHQQHAFTSSPIDGFGLGSQSNELVPSTIQVGAAGVAGAATATGAAVYQAHEVAQSAHHDQERTQIPVTPTSPVYPTSEESGDIHLLHGDAFRSSNYSVTTEGARLDNGGRSIMALSDDTEADPNRTPRMGSSGTRTGEVYASQRVGDHTTQPGSGDSLGSGSRLQDMRRKSEKALYGYISEPAPDVPPIPAAVFEQQQHPPTYTRMESTATVLPPGAFPKTPSAVGTPVGSTQNQYNPIETQGQSAFRTLTTSHPPQTASLGRNASLTKDDTAILSANHQRTTSTNTNRSARTARSDAHRRPKSPGEGSTKGWVLVNVEPRGVRSSNSIGHSQGHGHTHTRNISEPAVSNVRVNHPSDSANATAPVDESSGSARRVRLAGDVPGGQSSADEANNNPETGQTDGSQGALEEMTASFMARRKGSLRKKRPAPPESKPSDDGSIGRKGLFGLFNSKKKKQKKQSGASDATEGTTDDADTDGDPNTKAGTTKGRKRQNTS